MHFSDLYSVGISIPPNVGFVIDCDVNNEMEDLLRLV